MTSKNGTGPAELRPRKCYLRSELKPITLANDLLQEHAENVTPKAEDMGEDRKSSNNPTEDIIAAFDRERAEANELRRRHTEQVRSSRTNDRPVGNDRGSGRSSH